LLKCIPEDLLVKGGGGGGGGGWVGPVAEDIPVTKPKCGCLVKFDKPEACFL